MAQTRSPQTDVARLHHSTPLLACGALLCATVSAIHITDQGGLTDMESPPYVGYLFYVLEIAGVIAALLLITRRAALAGWVLALGVAVGPASCYIMSRSIGLPYDADDIGNWTEPLGVASLVTEGLLLAVAFTALRAERRVEAAKLSSIGQTARRTTEPVTMDVTLAGKQIAKIIDAAQDEPVLLQRCGKPTAVVIHPARYDELMTAHSGHHDDGAPAGQINTSLIWGYDRSPPALTSVTLSRFRPHGRHSLDSRSRRLAARASAATLRSRTSDVVTLASGLAKPRAEAGPVLPGGPAEPSVSEHDRTAAYGDARSEIPEEMAGLETIRPRAYVSQLGNL